MGRKVSSLYTIVKMAQDKGGVGEARVVCCAATVPIVSIAVLVSPVSTLSTCFDCEVGEGDVGGVGGVGGEAVCRSIELRLALGTRRGTHSAGSSPSYASLPSHAACGREPKRSLHIATHIRIASARRVKYGLR